MSYLFEKKNGKTIIQPSQNNKQEPIQENIDKKNEVDLSTVSSRKEETVLKKEMLEKELVHLDMDSVRDAVITGDISKLRKEDKKKMKVITQIQPSEITLEQFRRFETFIPPNRNYSGVKYNTLSPVSLTEDNDKFTKWMMYTKGVKRVAVVNHCMDIIRVFFKDQIK